MKELSLNEIGLLTGTDKSTRSHGYLEFYDGFLSRIRASATNLLEIGVDSGASARMWAHYFPQAKIVGFDIEPNTLKHSDGRITVQIGNQNNVNDLDRIGKELGPFDIIIDDGSHVWADQIKSFQHLYQYVKPNGFYIIEDLQTSFSYHDCYEHFRGDSEESAVDYLVRFAKYVVGRHTPPDEPDPFMHQHVQLTEF